MGVATRYQLSPVLSSNHRLLEVPGQPPSLGIVMMASAVGWALTALGSLVLVIGILPSTVPVKVHKGTGFRRASWLLTGAAILAIALGQIILAAL